jgi:predicted acyl esterase
MSRAAYRPYPRRLLPIVFGLVLVVSAGCGDDGDPSPTTTSPHVDLSHAQPAPFVAHGSVQQLYVTDAAPHTDLELVAAGGAVAATGTADDNGTLIFRDVKAGDGYVLATQTGSTVWASNRVTVTTPDQVPPPSFYAQQQINKGYGYIETRDGTKLAINVYLPGPVEDGPYPTVIEYSGYDPANPDAPQPGTLLASTLGYAAVGVNMRGTGCSGGAFYYFETLQSTDGYDAVEAIAAQPWVKFNKVGMVGISYPGITQLFVGQTQPPHLAAIAPLSIISDTGRGILYPGGILNNGFAISWTMDRQHDAMPGGQPWSKKLIDAGDQVCIDNQQLRGQTPDLVALVYQNSYYDPKTADPIAPTTFVHKINVPVFLAGAWQDEQTGGYFPTMLDHFTGTNKLHFTMTNGSHVDSLDPAIFTRWTEFLSFYVAQKIPKLPSAASLIIQGLATQIFGVTHLPVEKDRFTGAASFADALARFEAEPKVRLLFESGAGTQPGAPVPGFEQSFDQWPIASVQPTVWYFRDNGLLDSTPPTGSGADSYIYDSSRSQLTTSTGTCNGDPMPGDGTKGGTCSNHATVACDTDADCTSSDEAIWTALPAWNWRQLDTGKAVTYATDPLPTTLVMAGSGSVDLWLKSTVKDTDIQVTLSEIRPDGHEVYVQNGWLRASQRKLDAQASSVLRPVQTHRKQDAADLPAGKFVAARVELFPFAHVFRAGSRLRISVEAPGAERPRWEFDALQFDGQVVNTIGRAAATPSRVVLPVVPGVQVSTPLPLCPSLRGQPCRAFVEFTNTPG